MNTKDKIVIAAIDLFAEKGYTETTIREIADEVSLKAGSLYNYFPSKMALLEHILEMYSSLLEQTVPDLGKLPDDVSAREFLQSMFFTFPEDEHNLYPKILKIILQEQYRNERIHLYMKHDFLQRLQQAFKELLDMLVERGKLAPDLDTARYAKLINCVSVASAVEYCHYTAEEYAEQVPITQFELLDLVIDTMT